MNKFDDILAEQLKYPDDEAEDATLLTLATERMKSKVITQAEIDAEFGFTKE